jgi:predicted Zn-dependent protease
MEDLRRRVEDDPASLAFAQLAEECRRAGRHEEAVRVGRAGLARHPDYLSARVTLGRALMALGRHDDACLELERVVAAAPDNLAALRSLADLRSLARGVTDGPGGAPDGALVPLEAWLSAIESARAARRGDRPAR